MHCTTSLMKLPCIAAFLPPAAGGRRGGASSSSGAARRLQQQLPTLHRAPHQWRSLLVCAADLQEQLSELTPRPTLTGRWHKNKEASDPMDEACDAVALPWIFRKAIAVLNVLELEDCETHFSTNLKAGGIMDVIEKYPWSGEAVLHPRRDKRGGKHTAHVTRTERGPCIVCSWQDPYGGDCTDTFELSDCGNMLTQHSDMTIRETGRRVQYKTVYHRVHQ